MSQKINPISNKLGIVKTWNQESLKYGRNFKNSVKVARFQKYIFNYINQLCINHDLLIENVNIIQRINQIFINVFVVNLKSSCFNEKTNQVLKDTISYWVNSQVVLSFYKSAKLGSTSFLINNYILHLFIKKSLPPKKILQFIYKILEKQLNNLKINYTAFGIKVVKFKGFKIEVSGCFESSRSQMSKTIKCSSGINPLTRLNGYIDYSNNTLFTKFGSCGFKIWMFYEFK